MDLRLEDEWVERNSMQYAFKEAMRKNDYPNGNPKQQIDYREILVGTDITIGSDDDKDLP